MNEFKYELTQEQKDAVKKFVKRLVNTIDELWNLIKKALNDIAHNFNTYIRGLNPKKRYKFLKAIGIKNYLPFFHRDGVIHCRNNC
jgi:molecular chaperone GrpE (heat shock protein)